MRKKISVLLLAAGMVLAAAMPSQAIDFKVKGVWQIGFHYSNVFPNVDDNMHPNPGPASRDKFNALQAVRLHLDAVASENLSGSVELDISGSAGSQEWGKASDGAALGTDGGNVKVRFAYLDWVIPNTKIKTRMGLQMIMMPGVLDKFGCSAVFGKEMAGITVSTPILEGDVKMDAALFWARPWNDNATSTSAGGKARNGYLDNTDIFGLTLPIKGDGWKVTPWAMYALMGKYSLTKIGGADGPANFDKGRFAPRAGLMPILGGGAMQYYDGAFKGGATGDYEALRHNKPYGDGFWVGLPVSFNVTDAFRVNLEGVYGSVDMGSVRNYKGFRDGRSDKSLQLKRAGWYVGTKLEYNLGWGTPGLIAWYGSGDDSNPYNGSERLPQFNTPWATTALAGGDTMMEDTSWKVLGHNPGGQVAVVAQIDKMSFIEDLSHTLRLGYFHGTNSPKMPRKSGMSWPLPNDGAQAYLTTLDHAYEVSLQNKYKIYDNLTLGFEGAYVRLNLDNSVWKDRANKSINKIGKDHYRFAAVFTYNF